MGLLKTFAEIQASRILQVAASCPTSPEFMSLVNTATDLLLQRGDWPGTVLPARFQVNNGCIVWPRLVGQVRRINLCRWPVKKESFWWDFVDLDKYAPLCGPSLYNWGGGCSPVGVSSMPGRPWSSGELIGQGRVPTYNDMPADTPRYIRLYAQNQNDYGQSVTVFGMDANGQSLTTTSADGTTTPGIQIALASPFGSSSQTVQRIDAVQKPVTQGPVTMFAYDPASNTMLDLAYYEPGETSPQYAKDQLLVNAQGCFGCSTDSPFTVVVLFKVAFVPVVVPTDYVLIPSVNALKKAIQSIKFGEANDVQQEALFMQSAVNDLNHVLNNEMPMEQTPVDEGFQGEAFGVGLQSVL